MRRQSQDKSNQKSKKKFGDRRKPFSHAKKKEYIKEKRKRKKEKLEREMKEEYTQVEQTPLTSEEIKQRALETIEKSFENQDKPTRLYTVFDKESKEEVDKRIKESLLPLQKKDTKEVFNPLNTEIIEMPKRPNWSKDMSPEELDEQEKEYFKNYVAGLYEKYEAHRLNYFEHNLEVWRQLWRTLEISHICLLIADSRYPLFHFPVSLYKYVTEELKKPLIFVLNKADLVPAIKLQNWVNWFNENFPKLRILTFTSFLSKDEQIKKQKRNKKEVDRDLVYKIWDACEDISVNELKLPNAKEYWEELRETLKRRMEGNNDEKNEEEKEHVTDMITIGLIGHPNVGKSCILNGLVGKTIASTSYTPGHTKHIQTYFVSKHVRLCDSPGLVFPSLDMPKELQIVCGTYPIAKAREPYSAVRWIAERVDLVEMFKLKLPEDFEYWSPYAICTAYAIKRGYVSKRGGRPDVYRAGNEILRFTLYGRVLLAFDSPNAKEQIEVKEDLKPKKQVVLEESSEEEEDEENEIEIQNSNPFDVLDEIDL